MTTVLVPIDGSERALSPLPWATLLAGSQGKVILLRVIPPHRQERKARLVVAGLGGEDGRQSVQDVWRAAAEAELDEAAQALREAGAEAERLVAVGEPDEEIVSAAAQQGVDLIVMASHGRGAIGRALFGSVADRVSRTATVPVLIVRAPEGNPATPAILTRLVVPLDGSEIAERALPVAIDLARRLGIPARVVRAIDPTTTLPISRDVFGAAPTVNAEITDRLWQEAETEARTTVSEAVTRLMQDGIDASGAVLNGSPFFAISEATKPGDLIVLTSHGRGGVRRWLLGSVAEKLVREAPVPVLLVPAAERSEGERAVG
jgi:nucleotide-binding universal stress UspA family protein